MNDSVILVLLLVSLIVFLGSAIITYWRERKTLSPPRTLSDLALSRGSSRSIIAWSLIATAVGGAVTIGFVGLVYLGGTVFLGSGVALVIGLSVLKALVPKIRSIAAASGSATFETFIAGDNRGARVALSFVNVFAFFCLAASQIISVRLLAESVAPRFEGILVISTLVVLGIYLMYGVKGVFYSEKIQALVTAFWVISILYILVVGIRTFEGVPRLDIRYISGLGMGNKFLIAVITLLPWTVVARADMWQRIVSAETDEGAQSAIGIMIVVMSVLYLFFTLAGVFIRLKYPDLPDHNGAALMFIDQLPTVGKYLAVMGIFAALISSADSFMNLTAVSFAGLFHENHQRIAYVVSIIATLCMLFIVIDFDLGTVVIVSSTVFAIVSPAFFQEVFFRTQNRVGYMASILSGVISLVGLWALGVDPNIVFAPAAFVALVALVIHNSVRKSLVRRCESKN